LDRHAANSQKQIRKSKWRWSAKNIVRTKNRNG